MTGDLMMAALLDKTITYDSPDSRRIAHLVKVHGYARAIGLQEGLDEQTQFCLGSCSNCARHRHTSMKARAQEPCRNVKASRPQ
ncbi:MAG: hypothetical protein VB088_08795 [Sphaerochaeta sp.]|nr:hypothetical protein [Sphaerochaeta sp.]